MNTLSLLDFLETEINRATPVFMGGGRVMLDREKCMDIIEEIRRNLPEDIKLAQQISTSQQQILAEAEKEAQHIIDEAEERIRALVNEHEISQKAYQLSQEIIANAQKNAREIRLGANSYADDVLLELSDYLKRVLETVEQNRHELNHDS